MLHDFGLREQFHWDRTYLLPLGFVARKQWEQLEIEQRRYGHLDELCGRPSAAFWKRFYENYVVPMIELGDSEVFTKTCTCAHPYFVERDDGLTYNESKDRILTLDDVYDFAKNTDVLPLMSPLFTRKGFTPNDVALRGRCGACRGGIPVVVLGQQDADRWAVANSALRRAPFARFTRSLFTDSSSALANIANSAIPKYLAVREVKRMARMITSIDSSAAVYLRHWTPDQINAQYYLESDRYNSRSAAVISIFLQMLTGQNARDFYPSWDAVLMMDDPDAVKKLVRMSLEYSFPPQIKKRKKSQSSYLPDQLVDAIVPFKTLISAVKNDVDPEILMSLAS